MKINIVILYKLMEIYLVKVFLFLFLSFFNLRAQCSFISIPIKAFKKSNINLDFHDPNIRQYLENFDSADELLKNWFIKTTFIEFKVGNPQLKVHGEIDTTFPIFKISIDEKFQNKNNINIFNYSQSFIEKTISYSSLGASGLGYDSFYFDVLENLENAAVSKREVDLDFYVNFSPKVEERGTKLKDLNYTFNFDLGLSSRNTIINNTLLNTLKERQLISSYDFKIEYYDKPVIFKSEEIDEIGRIIIGPFEQLYNQEKYPKKFIHSTKLIPSQSHLIYALNFSKVYMTGIDHKEHLVSENETFEFNFHQTMFTGMPEYKNLIKKEFFDKYGNICQLDNGNSYYDYDVTFMYEVFICDTSIKNYKNNFPILKLDHLELNYTFNFTYDDLFREYNGKTYFLVAFPLVQVSGWRLGTIFLKKYELLFNADTKMVSFYNPFPENNVKETNVFKKVVVITITVVLICLFIYGGFYIVSILKRKRKIKAQELEDAYDYETVKEPSGNIEMKSS